MVTFYAQFLCSDWSNFAETLCSILKLVCFDSWSWQSLMSTCDIFNCLFPIDVQNQILLLSRVFCYSWLVCLLAFWLRNASLVKVGNPISDGIVFVFHLAWCVKGFKSLKRFWPYLIAFRSTSRMVNLSSYCIWCLFFCFYFHEVEHNLCGKFRRIFSYKFGWQRKLWAIFLPRLHLWKKQNTERPA